MDSLRIGIIGCGALGRVHVQRFAAIPGCVVAAVSDPNEEAMRRAAAELPAPPLLVADYRELLDSGLDAVCIASPDGFHVPQVLDALSANLHVLCEKPLTRDSGDLQAVIDSKEEVGRVVAMTYPRRYDAGMRKMREEILSGRWGRVTMITAYNAEDWITPNRNTWRHDPAICPGGFFYDASGHQIDSVLWITGLTGERVRANVSNRGLLVPMVIWGNAELIGGVPMSFTFVGDAKYWREQINIHCEGADFAILNSRAYRIDSKVNVPLAPDAPEETADEAFFRLLRGEGPNWAPPEELWPVLTFTNAALRSAETGDEEGLSTDVTDFTD